MVPIMSLSLFVIAAARLRGIVDDFAPYDPQHGSHGYGKSHGAKSGEGSKFKNTKPFIEYLEKFLREKQITSMVEASCGHWPSGWQMNVSWPAMDYVGVDVMPGVIEEDKQLLNEKEIARLGLKTMDFRVGDITEDELPPADLLLTKDTLIHFPNAAIEKFLAKQVDLKEPKYKYVMYVNDDPGKGEMMPRTVRERWEKDGHTNPDLQHFNQFMPRDMSAPPFKLPVVTEFQWLGGPGKKKLVQVQTLIPH